MKNLLVASVVLSLAMLAGCEKGTDEIEQVEAPAETHTHADGEAHTHDDARDDTVDEDYNTKTPGDLSDALQDKMLGLLASYNTCMQERRPEYFTGDLHPEAMAAKTMEECEVDLTSIQTMLDENGVNKNFTLGMLKSRRNKSARKLMGNVMNAKVAREMQREQEGGARN